MAADMSIATRQELLDLARNLDRLGRNTQELLCRQLDQLAREIDEFEREKAAWRRQLRRECSQIAEQRKELERLCAITQGDSNAPLTSRHGMRQQAADSAARQSCDAPLRLLLNPGKATPGQVGALLFEISKLNRDLGGQGVRFEIAEVRQPKKRLLARKSKPEADEAIFELHGFSTLPLKARGNHVTLDVDLTERVEVWIAFKSQLLQSALTESDLATTFRQFSPVEQGTETRVFVREATRSPTKPQLMEQEAGRDATGALIAASVINSVRQQVLRMESCCERLAQDTGLAAQIEMC